MSLGSEELQSEDGEESQTDEGPSLEELYRAAKDENELLEFKNYELMFKIQELEQNQKRILGDLAPNGSRLQVSYTTCGSHVRAQASRRDSSISSN